MLDWAKSSNVERARRQIRANASLKIFTNDWLVLLRSRITDKAGHWFPIVYSIVPRENMETTTFHLNPNVFSSVIVQLASLMIFASSKMQVQGFMQVRRTFSTYEGILRINKIAMHTSLR